MDKNKYKGQFFVIDTSSLLFDPTALIHFRGGTVVLPVTVVQELDKHKDRSDHIGNIARQIIRSLYDLKKEGNLTKGVKLGNSEVTVQIIQETLEDMPNTLDKNVPDDRILSVCLSLIGKTSKKSKVHLVTNDLNLSIKANAYGVDSFDFQPENRYLEPEYKGFRDIDWVEEVNTQEFYKDGKIKCPDSLKPVENEFFYFKNPSTGGGLFRCIHKSGYLHKLEDNLKCYKISPLNNEQLYALTLLLDPEIKLVTLTGYAGTGKTLLSIAAGLIQSIEPNFREYQKLIISRSLTVLAGKDKLGFLPGNLREKLDPYLVPLRDAVDFVLGEKSNALEYLTATSLGPNSQGSGKPRVEIEPLQYIKGRTLRNSFFIVDEAQNLSLPEMKTIISRVGEESKIVLLGDADQVDNPYLNKINNGLTQVIEKFKGCPIYGHVNLKEGVRSALATEAAGRL